MDPLSAASLASCVIQMIDFGAKVVSKTSEIYGSASGALVGNLELEQVTKDLLVISQRLTKSLQATPKTVTLDTEYQSLGQECQGVATELLSALSGLKAKGKSNKWTSFRHALLSIWRKDQIESLEKRLDRFRQQLILRLLATLRTDVELVYQQQPDLEKLAKGLGETFLQHISTEQWQSSLMTVIRSHTGYLDAHPSSVFNPALDRKEILQSKFLRTLGFVEISERQERIPEALMDTFEWIFHDPEPGAKPWANFATWLEKGDGIYWISGKAGSGKSTLMKFLDEDTRTTNFLRIWSKESVLITSGFFFWNSGSEIQMSQEGLLRSLLHNIAKTLPDIIPELFPERWEILSLFEDDQHPWTAAECMQALRRLTGPKFAQHMFFFLIDGLDEFSGNHNDLISLLRELTAAPNVKICAASRPWIVFQDAFKSSPSLQVQDLTLPDIKLYVNTNFHNHDGFRELKAHDPLLATELCTGIVQKCSGVFLWVRLVVQSLLSGIANGDRVSDLHQRLDQLPDDLDALFRKILQSTEPFYKAHASQLYQICRAARSITILRLAFADEEDERFWQVGEPIPISDHDCIVRMRTMKRRLDSRTKGLLEVGEFSKSTLGNSASLLRYSHSSSSQRSSTVQYLHRTVKDFVQKPDVWEQILAMTTEPFDPYLSLCKGYLLEIKTIDLSNSTSEDLWRLINRALAYASKTSSSSHAALIPLLDEVNSAATVFSKHPSCLNSADFPRTAPGHTMLLPLALTLDLHFWVRALLERGHPVITAKFFKPYLLGGLDSKLEAYELKKYLPEWLCSDIDSSVPSEQSLELLLEYGADVNERYKGSKVWEHILCGKGVMEMLIPYGICTLDAEDMISFRTRDPERAARIDLLLQDHPAALKHSKRKKPQLRQAPLKRGIPAYLPPKRQRVLDKTPSDRAPRLHKPRKKTPAFKPRSFEGLTTEELERMQLSLFAKSAVGRGAGQKPS